MIDTKMLERFAHWYVEQHPSAQELTVVNDVRAQLGKNLELPPSYFFIEVERTRIEHGRLWIQAGSKEGAQAKAIRLLAQDDLDQAVDWLATEFVMSKVTSVEKTR